MVGLKVKSYNATKNLENIYHISCTGGTSDYVKAKKIHGVELALL